MIEIRQLSKSFGFIPFNVEAGALDIRPYAKSMFLATKTIENT
jgi:hypothetical protein